MKNIIKFILRMAVTAGIVVGIVALIMHFTNKPSDSLTVANTSASFNISKKLNDSHEGLMDIVTTNNTNDFENKVNGVVYQALVNTSVLLQDYYNYYINLTCFENSADANLKSTLLNSINSLNQKADASIKYLAQVKSANNYVEKNARLVNMYNALCNQTEILFETCSLLKQYVYKVNYQTEVCTIKTEAVLEMAKDSARVVFDVELKNNVYGQKATPLVVDTTLSGFNNVLNKACNMQPATNSIQEINFVYNYNKIDKTFIKKFFAKVGGEKATYIGQIANFMGEAPEGETADKLAQQQQEYLQQVYNFMLTSY